MPTPKECQQNAEDCLRLASEATTIYVRGTLLELAEEFRKIANNSSVKIAEQLERRGQRARG
jgi:hypothetical protein